MNVGRVLAVFAAAFAVFAKAAVAQSFSCPALATVVPGEIDATGNVVASSTDYVVTHTFTPGGPGGMFKPAWRVSFAFAMGKGLYITGAWFRKSDSNPWMKILEDARVSEIFVPYHHDDNFRFYDIGMGGFYDLTEATAADAGPCGTLVGGKVIYQLNNSELAWKNDLSVRYREEMVLWATFDADNYNYVMRYGFRDDGTITLRLGATASNFPLAPDMAHMHDALWRIDMDLNGPDHDSALWMKHTEPRVDSSSTVFPSEAEDTHEPFNGGVEGSAIWKAEEFNHLLVEDTQTTNAATQAKQISYEFMPVRMGRAVHSEDFSGADFWVTHSETGELDYPQITSYVADHHSISDTDIVVWHLSPMHHESRDEDGFLDQGYWNGVALIMWSGLDIRPRNLWNRTPLYDAQCEPAPTDMKAWVHNYSGTYANVVGWANGSPSGMVQTTTDIPVNHASEAISLAADGRIDFAASSAYAFDTQDFSIDFWVKTTDTLATTFIDTRKLAGDLRGIVVFAYEGNIGLQMADGVVSLSVPAHTNFVAQGPQAKIADGSWHHIAITVDRDDPLGIKFYRDGVQIGAFDPMGRAGSLGTTLALTIGHDLYLNRQGGAFKINDVEFFSRILDPSEITTLVNYRKCPPL